MRGLASRCGPLHEPGFTLLEMIGVVAILAILASLMAPAVIRSIDQAAKVRDEAELKSLADALQSAIRRNGQIPAPGNMAGFIASEMGVATNQVLYNSRNVQRMFVPDPSLTLGSGGLPFSQIAYPAGITNRANLRILIISSLSAPLPSNFDFNIAWATPDNSTPADWPSSWQGKGEDLMIQRLDLTPLFHHVILNNIGGGSAASFSVESGGVPSSMIPIPSPLVDTWYLERTVVCLYNSATLETKTIVQDDATYFFQNVNGTWLWLGSLK